MRTFRSRDMRLERELARFMDDFLYKDGRFSKFLRTDKIEDQKQGSDIILSIPSLNLEDIVVDEKGSTQYMDRPLPTFSLELSFLSGYNEIPGWFVNNNKTQYYMFIWPRSEKKFETTYDDFIEAEYALVSKQAIYDFLATKGYTKEKLIEKNKEIRENAVSGQIDKGSEDFWFYYSTHLGEKPVNIIIRKKIYIDLSVMHGVIRKNNASH